MSQTSAITPAQFTTFGDLLKFLRRRVGLSQTELSIAVGYSVSHISRLEKNQRAPDAAAIAARFVPELDLEKEPLWVARLLELAASSHAEVETKAEQSEATTAGTPSHNLPTQSTSFVGRDKEIAEITRLLTPAVSAEHDVRLLTLTGAGGSGKTRLAIRSASELLAEFPDGVFFVNLAPLAEALLVIPTIAQNLGVTAMPRQTALEALQEHLRAKRMLLVLDNLEQVTEAAPLLAELLKSTHLLKILVTSRVVLHLSDEREFRVTPLPLPAFRLSSAEELKQNEAIELFVQRAQQVHPEFQLTRTNAATIAEICIRLDGLPLAIELAAARMRILSTEELLARLSNRLVLLKGGARDLPARQQTLRSTIDWSYRLLASAEQKLFARLGVFVGGWTLNAAEQVCNVSGDLSEIVDGLQSLVDHNLIQQRFTDGGVRFSMLETLREYALEQLEASAERETVQKQHANFFLALVDAAASEPFNENHEGDLFNRVVTEQDNLRAALAWSLSFTGSAEIGLRLAEAMSWFSHGEEFRALSERALAYADAQGGYAPGSRAEVLLSLGQNLASQGDYVAGADRFAESLDLFQRLGDIRSTVLVLERWGWVAREQGHNATAIARLEEARALARQLKMGNFICTIVNTLAEARMIQGDTVLAKTLLEENLRIARELGDVQSPGWTLNHLGHVAQVDTMYKEAERLHTESLLLFRRWPEANAGISESLHCLGETALAQADTILATTHLSESLRYSQEWGYQAGVAWCLAGLAGVAVLSEEPKRAGFLWGAAEHLRQRVGVREGPATHDVHQRLMSQAREQLGEQAFVAAWAQGEHAPIEDIVKEILSS